MGYAMAERLAKRAAISRCGPHPREAEPLAKSGAKIPCVTDLAACDVVFTMVSTGKGVKEVLFGANGVFSQGGAPKIVVTHVDLLEESAESAPSGGEGVKFLSAPVSGQCQSHQVGQAHGRCVGAQERVRAIAPYLEAIGQGVSYVGDGELSRIAKICHNVMLGVVIQNLCEITMLAEKAGMQRHAFLDFLNKSVMGSAFTRYKTPALSNLDFHVTFTPELLRKDLIWGSTPPSCSACRCHSPLSRATWCRH